jgi:hypothetical protein
MEKLKKLIQPQRRQRQEKTAMDREPVIPTGGFQHWAVAFIVCNFNVDVGPEASVECTHCM